MAAAAADPWERLTEAVKAPPAEAQKAIEALLLENPAFHAAHYDLGTLLLAGDPAAAAEHLEAATGASDTALAADAWHNLALARLSQGRLDEALAAAVRAANLNPQLGPARDRIRSAVLVAKDEARRRAEEEAKKLRLPHAELPRAAVGEDYEARIAAAGGAGGYGFAVAGKSELPKGLALDPDGRLHGRPEAPQRYELSLTVTDGAKATATGTVTLLVLPPPAIITETLPEAIVGQPYRAELACVGLLRPRWSAEGLPAGVTMASDPGERGVIAGTPSAAGETEIAVVAADDRFKARRAFRFVVSDSFAPDVVELPPATAWAQYHHHLGVRGPALEYRWQLAAPVTGMALAQDGTLTGAPESEGRLAMPVTITASGGRSRRFELTLPVNPAPVIDEEGTIQLTQNRPIERALKFHGGTPPYAWSIADGSLPAGLRLDADGALRGATTTLGSSEATVALKDHWQAQTQKRLTFKVEEAPKDQQKPQDQKKDDQKKDDQKKDDDQKQDDQKSGDQKKDDQKNQDQKPGDQKPGDQQQGDQKPDDQKQGSGKPEDQKPGDQKPEGQKAGDQKPADQQQAADAQTAKNDEKDAGKDGQNAATARWLESLPPEDHEALRGQLLRRAGPPPQKGNPW